MRGAVEQRKQGCLSAADAMCTSSIASQVGGEASHRACPTRSRRNPPCLHAQPLRQRRAQEMGLTRARGPHRYTQVSAAAPSSHARNASSSPLRPGAKLSSVGAAGAELEEELLHSIVKLPDAQHALACAGAPRVAHAWPGATPPAARTGTRAAQRLQRASARSPDAAQARRPPQRQR